MVFGGVVSVVRAATVVIGDSAVAGDVVVATIAYGKKANDRFHVESSLTDDGSFDVWLLNRLVEPTKVGFFTESVESHSVKWSWRDMKRVAQESVDNGCAAVRVNDLLDAAEHYHVVGFCPRSEVESKSKVESALSFADVMIKDRFGGIPHNFVAGDALASHEISVPLRDNSAAFLCAVTTYAAELAAHLIRFVRLLDMEDLYPGMKFREHWGYSSGELNYAIKSLREFRIDYHRDQWRGEITEAWLKGMPPVQSKRQETVSTLKLERRKDQELPFDRQKAEGILSELAPMASDSTSSLNDWEREFVESLSKQIQQRDLTPRQMYYLDQIRMRRC